MLDKTIYNLDLHERIFFNFPFINVMYTDTNSWKINEKTLPLDSSAVLDFLKKNKLNIIRYSLQYFSNENKCKRVNLHSLFFEIKILSKDFLRMQNKIIIDILNKNSIYGLVN